MTENDDGPRPIPQIPMPARTVVMDAGTGRELLVIDGYMPLPIGARIQLGRHGELQSDAIVTGVRLWGAAPPGRTAAMVLEAMTVAPGDLTDQP